MSVSYQLSDKRGDAILVVKAEGPAEHQDAIYSAFGAAVQDAGLDSALQSFGTSLVAAVATAQPLVQPQEAWGQPPVAPYQPAPAQPAFQPQAQPQVPGAVNAPGCQHGQKVMVTGEKNGRTWKAWGCPADRNNPTKCGLEFIRG